MNEYQFKTLRSLRELLRSYSALMSLTREGDMTSAATLIDLSVALGDDPVHRVTVITARQRQAIKLHLIQDLHVDVVAKEMNIQRRVVYITVNEGLARLQKYLHNGTLPNNWQQWQLDYIRRHADKPGKELAAYVGRSHNAVRVLIYNLRNKGEVIGRSSGRVTRRRPARQRQSA